MTKPQSLIKSQTKQPSKSLKPIQSIHLLNAPDDLYYKITKKIETIRQEIEIPKLKKLARSPFKTSKEYSTHYTAISKIWVASVASLTPPAAATAATTTNGLDLSKSTNNVDMAKVVVPPAEIRT